MFDLGLVLVHITTITYIILCITPFSILFYMDFSFVLTCLSAHLIVLAISPPALHSSISIVSKNISYFQSHSCHSLVWCCSVKPPFVNSVFAASIVFIYFLFFWFVCLLKTTVFIPLFCLLPHSPAVWHITSFNVWTTTKYSWTKMTPCLYT